MSASSKLKANTTFVLLRTLKCNFEALLLWLHNSTDAGSHNLIDSGNVPDISGATEYKFLYCLRPAFAIGITNVWDHKVMHLNFAEKNAQQTHLLCRDLDIQLGKMSVTILHCAMNHLKAIGLENQSTYLNTLILITL